MALEPNYILPTNGMNQDSDERVVPPSQATFLKNVLNAINNLEDGNSGGQSTNALTPYPSISTNFSDTDLPRLRSYTINLGAIVFPATIISSVKDTTETDSGAAVANIAAVTAYMATLGFANTGGLTYAIANSTFIWQKIIFQNNGAVYYSSATFTQSALGALNGNNTCIGSYYDVKINQMVWFNYNDANRHNIQLYKADTDTYQTVLETPLFNFNYLYRISSIDLVVADVQSAGVSATIDRLLYWTDKYNPPRKINIDTAIAPTDNYWNHSNYLNYFTDDEFMCAVKYPPHTRISGSLNTTANTRVDYVDSNNYQFRQNFVYDDGEESKWSFISSLVVVTENTGSAFNNHTITLTNIDAGSSIVNKINIAFRVGNFGDWKQFYTIDRTNWLLDANISSHIFAYSPLAVYYEFTNENNYELLDQVKVALLFDELPLLAGSQEFLDNNIMCYADMLEDYSNLTATEIATCTIDITYPTAFNPAFPTVNKCLKGGGTYQFGLILYDEANRSTFVQTGSTLNKYINTVMENDGFYLQTIVFHFNALVFPTWVKKVSICRTQNTTIQRYPEETGYQQWGINDLLEFIDDAGTVYANADNAAVTQIRFKVSGITAYNANLLNNTSVNYQYVEGDTVTFMTVATNLIFPPTYGIITKKLRSIDSETLCCDIDTRIQTLWTAGHHLIIGDRVQLTTPVLSSLQNNLFYEITQPIDINQSTHQSTQPNVTLTTWDTYYVPNTTFMVVIHDYNGNPINGGYFEHHSFATTIPSSQGEDIGRPNTINENAKQEWHPSLVRYSYPYVQNTFINGLNSFDSGREKNFFRQYGNITRMYCEQFNLALIQEEKAFRVMVSRNLLTTATGSNQVTLTDEILSDAIEIQGNFGCQNGETFIGRQGQLFWCDLKRGAFVGGDFNKVEDISALYDKEGNATGIKTYATKQLKAIFNFNQDLGHERIYVHAGFDPKLNQWVFTNFGQGGTINKSFVNNSDNWNVVAFGNNVNETVAFKNSGYWQGFMSFTPEYYGICEGARFGNCMVSFKNGVPYFHNRNDESTYLNFYGVQCDKWIEIVSNNSPQSVKNFMNISVDSKSKSPLLTGTAYGATSVVTSNNQTSNIPIAAFSQLEGIWCATFFRNTSTGYTIFTGEVLKGTWCRVKLMGDTTQSSTYSEFRGAVIFTNKSPYTI